MGTVARINIAVAADMSKFTSGMKEAESALDRLKGWATSTQAAWAAAGAAMAASAAVGVGAWVQKSFEMIDANSKMANSFGLTLADLTGFQHAANLSGVAADELKIALQAMVKQLKPGEDAGAAFRRYADEIAGITDPVERAQRAMEVFGKQGAKMVNVLANGSAGLQAAAAEAQAFGLIVSEDAATAIQQANDNMSRMGTALEGVRNQIAAAAAPAVASFTDQLVQFSKDLELAKRAADLTSAAISRIYTESIRAYEGVAMLANTMTGNLSAAAKNFQNALNAEKLAGFLQLVQKAQVAMREAMNPSSKGRGAGEVDESVISREAADAQRFRDLLKTPWDRMRESVQRVQELFAKGKLTIQETVAITQKLMEQLNKAPKGNLFGGPVQHANIAGPFGGPLQHANVDEGVTERLKQKMLDVADAFRERMKSGVDRLQDEIARWKEAVESGMSGMTAAEVAKGIEHFKQQIGEFMPQSMKSGFGRQINLSHMNLRAVNEGTLTKHDPITTLQGKTMIQLLEKIAFKETQPFAIQQ